MFSLRKKVRRHKRGVCRFVGNDENFRGACRHINGCTVRTAGHLALGFGYVGVARSEDFRNLRNRGRTESHGGNRLSAADLINILNAAEFRSAENGVGNGRRRTKDHLIAARDRRGDPQHQHGGKKRRRTAWDVETDAGDRTRHLRAGHPRHRFHRHRRQFFRSVKAPNVVRRRLQGRAKFRRRAVPGRFHGLILHAHRLDGNAVKFCRESRSPPP